MALDGIVISSLVDELDTNITGGRITKIAQPEKDELLLTIKRSTQDENGKTVRSTKSHHHFGKSKSSAYISHRYEQNITAHGTYFLHGTKKALKQLRYYFRITDGT